MRNILGIHMDTLLQSRIAKSPLLNVHEISLSRKQRAATNAVSSGSALLVLQPPNQIVHDCGGNFIPLTRLNVTEQHQMTEQHSPVRTKAVNQVRPVVVLRAALNDVRNDGALEPITFHAVRLHPTPFLWRPKLP